jgi:hypothetical protein
VYARLQVLDILVKDVGVSSVFTDWAGTVSLYWNCFMAPAAQQDASRAQAVNTTVGGSAAATVAATTITSTAMTAGAMGISAPPPLPAAATTATVSVSSASLGAVTGASPAAASGENGDTTDGGAVLAEVAVAPRALPMWMRMGYLLGATKR